MPRLGCEFAIPGRQIIRTKERRGEQVMGSRAGQNRDVWSVNVQKDSDLCLFWKCYSAGQRKTKKH